MNNFVGFLVYLGVIFLGIITILFFVIAVYVYKFYKSGKLQNELAVKIEKKLEKIANEFKEIKNRITKL